MNDQSRLRWRCRRGIREMDLLLQEFLAASYPVLSSAEQQAFEQMLDEADLDLLAWITGRAEPPPDYGVLIGRLRRLRPEAGGG
jgi:antitoxin CptB